MNEKLHKIAARFQTETPVVEISPLGAGFINDTFVAKTSSPSLKYILQRKNKNVFPDVPAMMDNILAVTAHLHKKTKKKGGDPEREVMKVVKTHSGKPYHIDEEGEYWTVSKYIEDSVTYDRADSPDLAYKGALGIGRFQAMLADFDMELSETIKGFHNIRHRFNQWDEAVQRDAVGRVKDLSEEIGWIESRRQQMLQFWSMVEDGTIPRRVTHNDTKISNILFDTNGDVLCVIDLDTVMNGTLLNDFGDAIRSYANTGAEDDRNLDNVGIDISTFEAYTRGFIEALHDTLTQSEIDYLAFSALYITFEQVMRFLMDYIDGDTYYKVSSPDHNLIRTHAQYKLLRSMEENYDKMKEIVSRCKGA